MEQFVTIPGALATVVFGTWLVRDGNWALKGWLIAAYVLFVIALGIGGGILGRHSQRIAREASELVGQGVEESERSSARRPHRSRTHRDGRIARAAAFIYSWSGSPAHRSGLRVGQTPSCARTPAMSMTLQCSAIRPSR